MENTSKDGPCKSFLKTSNRTESSTRKMESIAFDKLLDKIPSGYVLKSSMICFRWVYPVVERWPFGNIFHALVFITFIW